MNKMMMSVLFASGNESKLNELTLHRTTASLPLGGRYRLIDFALSNMVNSGITTIGLVTRSNYSSLMDHIRMGRDWDLNRKNSGIAVFPPFVLGSSREIYKGKIEALHTILNFLTRAKEDYVVISNCNIAANVNFSEILETHLETEADITVLCKEGKTTTSRRLVLNKDSNNIIRDMYISESSSSDSKLISLNAYIIQKEKLVELVKSAYARGLVDFEKDILFKIVDKGKIYAYEVEGYASIIDDIKTYYGESMKLLNPEVRNHLFNGYSKIYTKVKDSVPTTYLDNADVKNSLIADGCVIDGKVENSILFRNVTVEKGAVVKNSILMENCAVQKDASLQYAITDKDVTISENRKISGFITYPIVIVKGKTV